MQAQARRVWKLPENVDTDALAPGAYMQFGVDTLAKHCLKRIRPEFAEQVRPGDVIVAGAGFGIGSSREQAVSVLRHLGVAAVIAPSFAGLYFRNAFNLGLLALVCPQANEIHEGDTLDLHVRERYVLRRAQQAQHKLVIEPIPEFLLEMAEQGGLMQVLKKSLEKPARLT